MTDEQRMREQFEKWADKQVLWQHLIVSSERDEWGGYQEENELDIAWRAWQAASKARDAEVQWLRLALSDILRRATLPVLPALSAHESVLADIAREARAALAGELEGGGS